MKKLVREKLPQVELVPDGVGHQAKHRDDVRRHDELEEKNSNVHHEQEFDGRSDRAAAKTHMPRLVLHQFELTCLSYDLTVIRLFGKLSPQDHEENFSPKPANVPHLNS